MNSFELFTVPGDGPLNPQRFYDICVEYPEHAHLKAGEPTVRFLMRGFDKTEAGRQILGSVHLPVVQGKLKELFDWMLEEKLGLIPDFLIILDADYWEAVTDREREILMFHEMSHCVQAVDKWGDPRFHRDTGEPVWALAGHDVEEFTSVVRRYGAWNAELEEFIGAARSGNDNV